MEIEIRGIEFATAEEAIQYGNAAGIGEAIAIGGKVLQVYPAEADRLDNLGVEFAYLFDHEMPDGTHRIMTVPVN